MTIADQIAARGNKPCFWIVIDGIPRRSKWSTGPTRALRISTGYGASFNDDFDAALAALPTGFDESIDLIDSKTTQGSHTFRVQDRAGDYAFMFSWAGGSSQPLTRITADLSRTATTITLASSTGIAEGVVAWLGRETLKFGTLSAGTTWNVSRGQYGSTATAHSASTTVVAYDDYVHTHPPFWRGRRVTLYEGDLTLTPETAGNSAVRYRGILEDLRYDAATLTWEIQTRSNLGSLDTEIGRRVFRATVTGPTSEHYLGPGFENMNTQDAIRQIGDGGNYGRGVLVREQEEFYVTAAEYDPSEGGYLAPFRSGTVSDTGFLRLGDSVFEVQYLGGIPARFKVLRRELCGTPALDVVSADTSCWEVFPTENPADDVLAVSSVSSGELWGYWSGGAFTFDATLPTLILNLLCSTGTSITLLSGGYNYDSAGGGNNYDTLPVGLGLGIPYTDIDIAAFEALTRTGRLASLSFHALRVFWDGEPFDVYEWLLEKLLRPTGAYLYTKVNGQLSIGLYEDSFGLDTRTAIDSGTTVADKALGYSLNMPKQIGAAEFASRTRAGGNVLVRSQNPIAWSRRLSPDKSVTRDATGIYIDDPGAHRVIVEHAVFLQTQHDQPRPIVRVPVDWSEHDIDLASRVSLANTALPSVTSGSVGLTADDGGWFVVAKRLDPMKRRLDATLQFVGAARPHIGPAAYASAWVAGTRTLTVAVNEFTPSTGDDNPVPNRDSDPFAAGVGDYVKIVSSRGVVKSDNAVRVSSVTTGGGSDSIVLDVAPVLGVNAYGGGANPFAAGDVLVLADYSASTTAHAQKYAFLANESTGVIGGTTDAAHKYGF